VNTAGTSVGRQALYNAFTTIKPTPGCPIGDYFKFSKLLEIRNQNLGTTEAIPDMMFKSHVFHSLPGVFDITVRMLQREADLSIEEIIDTLKRDEAFRLLKSPLNVATDALHASPDDIKRGL
jgi:hypothetical protein